jgi:WD40 repeat protein/serine/threonine protein kinase
VPADAPAGLCPRCLVAGGFSGTQLADTTDEEADAQATLHIVIPEDAALPSGVPRKLGKYELLEEVARGGMGIVYKARHTGLDAIVAVKLIRSGVLATPTDVERFQREARAAAKLQHPNIVSVHDIGEQDGQHYFSMDYVPGANLAELARTRPFSPKQAAEITRAVALAIHYAHGQGVLHRDIKPSNVILTPEQVPRVLDFGLARIATDDSQLTQSGTPMGSPCYMPPEQCGLQRKAEGGRQKAEIRSTGEALSQRSNETRPSGIGDRESRVGPWSDVYGLGAMLYELLTGRPPFHAPTAVETLRLVLESDPVLPRLFNRTLPTDLETICLKCLEKEPHKRYASAQELADELERFLADKPIRARRVTQAERLWRWCRRNPVVASMSGATLVLLLTLAIGSTIAAYRINQAHLELRRNAYAAQINVAYQALTENNLERAVEMLKRQRPERGEEDLRGFEWRYLWALCRDHAKTNFFDAAAPSIATSADGRWLAYGGGESKGPASTKVVVRDVMSHQIVQVLPANAGSLSFSPRTNLLAIADDLGVRLWDTHTWREIGIQLADAKFPAKFSPDGQWLVTRGTGQFQVWNTTTWQLIGTCQSDSPLVWWSLTKRLAFSPDSRLMITPDFDQTHQSERFKLWTLPELKELPGFAGEGDVDSVAFAADGRHLLTGGTAGALLMWDLENRSVVEKFTGHAGSVWDIAVSPDGRLIATASADRIIHLWDAATRTLSTSLRGHLREVVGLAFLASGRELASIDASTPGAVKLWDFEIGDQMNRCEGAGVVAGFSADSRNLFLATNERLKRWNLASNAIEDLSITLSDPFPVVFHGNWLAVGSAGAASLLAIGHSNGVAEIRDMTTRIPVQSWRAHSNRIESLAFSPDAKLLATGSTGGDVSIWNATTGQQLVRFRPIERPISCVAFSADGTTLAASVFGSRILLWDVRSGRERAPLEGAGPPGWSAAFSPDGKSFLAALTDNTAALWDLPSGKHRATLKGHFQLVMAVAFSPDGKTLVTGSDDRKIKLWHRATLQELATFTLENSCRTLKFSADGNTLAGGFQDGSVRWSRLWRAPSFAEIEASEAARDRSQPKNNAKDSQ